MPEKIEMWAIVELFGHQRIAGFVTEATIGGCSFVRVDIPPVDGSAAITKFYGNGAIYSMTPVSEEVARLFVEKFKPAPLNVYMPEIQKLEYNKHGGVGINQGEFFDHEDIDDR
jgi:hypothetical protein